MKKILFLAAATLTLAACSNDDNYIDQPVVSAAQISATIGNSAVSRASETSWEDGDEIGITMKGDGVNYVNVKYTTDVAADGIFTGSPMYFKNGKDFVTLTAYYPYNSFEGEDGDAPDEDGIIGASTAAENQTADNQRDIDFLYVSRDDIQGSKPKVELQFEHKMAKLTLIFKSGNDATEVSKITSYEIEGLKLDGTFDTATGVCAANGNAATLHIYLPAGSVTDGEAVAPLILFPQVPDGTVKLKITDTDSQDYAGTLSFKDGIVSGTNYQYTVTVTKKELSVKPSIKPWTPEEGVGDASSSDD